MAMMMAGRVLLVCALCVLWCGACGVYGRELENTAPGGCMAPGVLGKKTSYLSSSCNKTALTLPLRSALFIDAIQAEERNVKVISEEKNILGSGSIPALPAPPPAPKPPGASVSEGSGSSQTGSGGSGISNGEDSTLSVSGPEDKSPLSTPNAGDGLPNTGDNSATQQKNPSLTVEKAGKTTQPLPVTEEFLTAKAPKDSVTTTHTQEKNKNTTNSGTGKDSEAPKPSSTDDLAKQQSQDRVPSDLMKSAATGSPAGTASASISTTGNGDVQGTVNENGDDLERHSPKITHDDPEAINTNVGSTASNTPTEAVTNTQRNDTATPGDSDGSTAVSHTTSPLLLLLVACAAAAAVVAA
ncbi:mucin-associated surface protein [Trypanosoma cruzi]|nr:mucin-associated surface protein [Trypanosoma cruzi]